MSLIKMSSMNLCIRYLRIFVYNILKAYLFYIHDMKPDTIPVFNYKENKPITVLVRDFSTVWNEWCIDLLSLSPRSLIPHYQFGRTCSMFYSYQLSKNVDTISIWMDIVTTAVSKHISWSYFEFSKVFCNCINPI